MRLSCSAAGHCLAVDDEEPLAARTFSEIRGILQRRSSRFVALVQTEWLVPTVVLASPIVLSIVARYFAERLFELVGVVLAAGVLLLWLWWEYGVWRRRPMLVIRQTEPDRASGLEER